MFVAGRSQTPLKIVGNWDEEVNLGASSARLTYETAEKRPVPQNLARGVVAVCATGGQKAHLFYCIAG